MKMILDQPHYDDDMLSSLPFLLSFPYEIHEIITGEGDFLTEDAFYTGKREFELFKEKLNAFRQKKGMGPYIVDYQPVFGDVSRLEIKQEAHARITSILEGLLTEPCEYFIYPTPSLNPSHCLTRRIAESVLRSPYIFNIKCVLQSISQQEYLYRSTDIVNDYCAYYMAINEEDFSFFREELYPTFTTKLKHFPFESLENAFRSCGDRINTRYAQSFIPRRIVLN